MSARMLRRTFPIFLASATALLMWVEYFFKVPQIGLISGQLRVWGIIAASFTFVLAFIFTSIRHVGALRKRAAGWHYSIVLLAFLWGMTILGLVMGPGYQWYLWVFNFLPMVYGAMVGTTALFIGSAAYRSLRAKNGESTVMLVVVVIVVLAQVSIGELIWPGLTPLGDWLINVAQGSGMRGLEITIALGLIALSVRIISGLETRWLGE